MLAECCALLLIYAIAFLLMQVVRPLAVRAKWLVWLLATHSRGVVFVVTLALVGRALLFPVVGIPEPRINDEFSYRLMADTFSRHRLANPTPPAWEHFETFHVNLLPTYHSMYPVAQGMVLAFGQLFFHQPWIGIYVSTALMCGAICWALQAFLPPGWALLGGFLAVVRLALFSYWMNSYWGGSVAALGGALTLGSVVRLCESGCKGRKRVLLSCVFGAGLLILANSRPYEGMAFSVPLFVYFVHRAVLSATCRRSAAQALLPTVVIGAIGVAGMGYYNHATTGNPFLMPHILNHQTYWRFPLFIFQKEDLRWESRDPVFAKFQEVTKNEYEVEKTKGIKDLFSLEGRRFALLWFFYVGPALSFPVLIGVLASRRQSQLRIALWVSLSTVIAVALCLYAMPHYAAAATVVVCLFAVEGLRQLWECKHHGERAFVVAVCVTAVAVSLARLTGSSTMNSAFHFPDQRKAIAEQLKDRPGKHLVLVSYDVERHYPGNELVHNGADFGSANILWARSKGHAKDLDLCKAYPDRTFWSATTDDSSVSLTALDMCQH